MTASKLEKHLTFMSTVKKSDIQMPISEWIDSSWHFQNSMTSYQSEKKRKQNRLKDKFTDEHEIQFQFPLHKNSNYCFQKEIRKKILYSF